MLSAVSIDVDALRFYGAIHGQGPIDIEDDPVYSHALPRFFELLSEANIPSTVFFIAKDLDRAEKCLTEGLRTTRSELASHSFAHDYRLTRRSKVEIEADLRTAHERLSALAGSVFGFRAPGYNTSRAMLEVLVELGYTYDSSLLPAPAYFALRAAAIGRYALSGRPSASLLGDPRAFWGPTQPYRMTPEDPWRPVRSGPLVELPLAVEPSTRLPLIGTSWVLLPKSVRRLALERALQRSRCFVFEMHAVDLLDGSDPGVPEEIVQAQPDLQRPASRKLAAFRELFSNLASRTEPRTLHDIALQT